MERKETCLFSFFTLNLALHLNIFHILEKMIPFEIQYFRFNGILLFALGLMPFKRSKLVQLPLIICFSILITFILFQVYNK